MHKLRQLKKKKIKSGREGESGKGRERWKKRRKKWKIKLLSWHCGIDWIMELELK